MVYCRLKETKNNGAIYYVGRVISDITGEVMFYKDGTAPELLKQADKYEVWNKLINRIYNKNRDSFDNGDYQNELSIES